jgi:hypothetical protein
MEKRKAFNFYRSYYEVLEDLKNPLDRLAYLEAIIERQFTGKEPKLTGDARLVYNGQKHNIDKQVKGWEDKKGIKLTPEVDPSLHPSVGGSLHPTQPPSLQEQEKGQGQEEEKEQVKEKDKVKDNTSTIILGGFDKGKFYKKYQSDIEAIRTFQSCSLDDAIDYKLKELEELSVGF